MHKAQKNAIEIAEINGINPATVIRVFDTGFSKSYPCWKINDGLVIYENDPDCVVSIEVRPGRLVPAQLNGE